MNHSDREHIQRLEQSVNELKAQVNKLHQRVDSIADHSAVQPTSSAPSTPPLQVAAPLNKPNYQQTHKPLHQPTKPIPAQLRKPQLSRVSPPKHKASFDFSKLEWLLGIKGLMLLGVFIVVIGVGMFLKLAHDEGWIGSLSPTIRCGVAGAFGALLLGLGELLRRKINPLASSGFSAAGIATMYAAIYAASRMYDLLSPEIAFTLLAFVSLLGVLLGSLCNRVFLSLLSLIGAFIVPMLLSTDEPSPVLLPAYLLFLLATGLILSGWRGGAYSHVRRLAWWGTGIIGTMWLATMHDQSPISSLVFVTLAWTMTVIELAFSSRFFGSLRDRVRWSSSCMSGFIKTTDNEIRFNPLSLLTPEARWINALFGATIWSVISAGLAIKTINPDLVFLSPMVFAILSVIFTLVSMRIGLRPSVSIASKAASPASLFLSALLINASLLLVACIAIAFGGWIEVVAWLAVGIGAVEIARRFRFRAVGIFGISLMAYAVLRLLTYDLLRFYDDTHALSVLGLAFTSWTAQMMIGSIAFAVIAWRTRSIRERGIVAPIAIWLLAAGMLHAQTNQNSLGAAGLIIAAGACWMCVKFPIKSLRINAFVLAGVSMWALCIAQFDVDDLSEIAPNIRAIPMLIGALAWASIAALPSAGYTLRTIASTLVVLSGAIVIIKIDTMQGTETMLLAHAVYLGIIAALGKRFYNWSLSEISSTLALVLVLGWGYLQIQSGEDTLHIAPFASIASYTPIVILAVMLYCTLTLTKRALPIGSPKELTNNRAWMRDALAGMFWFFTLVASSIEIARTTHLFFDTDSAMGAAISIWWSVFAVASISLGFRLPRQLRWAGLTLLCIVGAKVLLLDTMTLAAPARIIASITVGLIIIATGVIYSRVVNTLEAEDSGDKSAKGTDQITTD